MTPNLLDLVLALVVLGAMWGGWRRGLIVAGADLLALIASVVFAFLVYPYGVAWAARLKLEWGVWTAPLAFLAAYVLAHLLLELLVSRLFKAVPSAAHAHGVNRLLGLVPGAVNGLIGATVVSMLLLSLPLADVLTRAVERSVLANRLAAPAEWLEAKLAPIFGKAVERTLTKLTITPDSQAMVKLPFTVRTLRDRTDLEDGMLDLLNEERRARGLRPLQGDPEAAKVARAHSRDMFVRGYFSHLTPEGDDPFVRMRRGGLRYRTAGENLALARTLPMAHKGLMESPGHRENILQPGYGRVGIGIVDGGRYGLMVTQNFRN